ncbi:MAG: hypothetical protein ACJAVR_000675 [Paracoccaceae bacterium]|jgi:uncharacterized protein YaiI (UPF0178 family)
MTAPRILVDADACPVKDEIWKVAFRRKLPAHLVANAYLRVPDHPLVTMQTVGGGFDEADDKIVELVTPGDVVITADILLADRCLKAGAAAVIAPNGKPFTENSIGAAVATRAIMADLRGVVGAEGIGGQAPFSKNDRSRFLSALDEALGRLQRMG